jgi:hypothetical protein
MVRLRGQHYDSKQKPNYDFGALLHWNKSDFGSVTGVFGANYRAWRKYL